MNTRVNKAYFLIPVLYTAVIVFFLYMQFSGSRAFSADTSGIVIEGRTRAGAPGKESSITELDILCNGVDFSLGGDNPMVLFSRDGLEHKLVPLDYRVTASGIDISLSKDLGVSFYRVNNRPDNLIISISAADTESINYVSLPVAAQDDSAISSVEGVPVLAIETGELGSFFLTLPESSYFDASTGSVVLYPAGGTFPEIVFERSATTGIDAFAYWAESRQDLVSEQDLERTVGSYLEKSVNALTGSRYEGSGIWTNEEGIRFFSEEALVMMNAESIGTPAYTQIERQLSAAAERNARDLGLLSATAFGNIVNIVWNYEQEQQDLAQEYTRRAADSDVSLFSEKDLAKVVLLENSGQLTDHLLTLSEDISEAVSDVYTAYGALSFYDEISRADSELGIRFSRLTVLLQTVLLPSAKIIADGIYLSGDGETADLQLSLEAGILMSGLSGTEMQDTAGQLGREVVDSVLRLSDDSGFLPANLSEDDSGVVIESGSIEPESIYPLLSDNTYYPSEDYFHLQTNEMISVINQADNFSVEKTGFGYRFTFDYPSGGIHTFAVRNFKPFAQMNLLGYVWNADHRFQQYFSGWWYDRSNQTLFIKIRHRQRKEEVLIYTEKPAAPEPEPAEEPAEGSETSAEESEDAAAATEADL